MAVSRTGSATPILDLEKPLPKRKIGRFLASSSFLFLAFLIFAALRGIILPILIFAFFIAVALLVTAVREAGHLMAGWCVGLRFMGVTVGPVAIRRDRKGWFRICDSLDGGLAYMKLDKIRSVRKRLTIFVLGGPLMNLFSAAVAALVFWHLFPTSPWLLPLATFVGLSGLVAVHSLIPRKIHLHNRWRHNDGLFLRNLYSSRTSAKSLIASHALMLQKCSGVSPTAWKTTWVAAALGRSESKNDDTSFATYQQASGIWEMALNLENYLKQSVEWNSPYRNALFAEASFFHAWFRDNLPKAQEWLNRYKATEDYNPLIQFRAEIALNCCAENYDLAMSQLDLALKIANRIPYPAVRSSFMELRKGVEDRRQSSEDGSSLPVTANNENCRCPKCDWVPRKRDRWSCTCTHTWNTLETQGRCPACQKQWTSTQCLQCGEWSPTSEWLQIETLMSRDSVSMKSY